MEQPSPANFLSKLCRNLTLVRPKSGQKQSPNFLVNQQDLQQTIHVSDFTFYVGKEIKEK